MPITISGDGGIAGVTNLDGGDFECATLVASGDTTLGPQAVGRAALFVDDSANSVGINTTTPAAAVFLEVADATDPIVSLNNTGNGEVRLGCTSSQGYLRTNSSHPLVLQTNATDALVIDTSQNVGVGTTAPSARIESKGNNSSTTQFAGFQGLRIHNSNGSAFGITADLNFTVGTGTTNRGAAIGVEYENPSGGNALYFATNPNAVTSNDTLVERVRIDSAGNVGINKSASLGAKLHIQDDSATDTTQIKLRNYKASVSTKAALMFELSTSAGQGGTAVIKGVCGTDAGGTDNQNDGGLEFQTSSGGAGTLATALLINKDRTLELPSNSPGIGFGNSTAANLLDDYEEGSWTPFWGSTTGSFGSITYTFQNGRYTKIGNRVFVECRLRSSALAYGTAGGSLLVGGLPFTNNSSQMTGGSPSLYNINVPTGTVNIATEGRENASSFYVALCTRDDDSFLNVGATDVGQALSIIRVAFYYRTNS